jgi:hypothetical protein
MRSRASLAAGILLLFVLLAGLAVQAQVALTVVGLDGGSTTYSLEQLRQMPQESVSMAEPHMQVTVKYEGVLLRELLTRANTPSGQKLRGDDMRDYVDVAGKDGYRAVFALAELDPVFQDNKVLVAISGDGKPLGDTQGPVRIIAPEDKRPARCVRMVTTITVRRAP